MKRTILLAIILIFSFSCKKDFQKKYKKAYSYMENSDITALENAVKEFDDAYQTAIASLFGRYDALVALGIKLNQNHMYLEAAGLLEKAVKIEQQNKSNFTQAANKFQKATKIRPLDGEAYYRLGLCYGNYAQILDNRKEQDLYLQKSEETFRTGLNSDGKNYKLLYGLGILYQIKADNTSKKSTGYIKFLRDSRQYFEKALSIRRDYIPALFGAAKSHFLLKNYNQAKSYYESIQQMIPDKNNESWKNANANLKIVRARNL